MSGNNTEDEKNLPRPGRYTQDLFIFSIIPLFMCSQMTNEANLELADFATIYTDGFSICA